MKATKTHISFDTAILFNKGNEQPRSSYKACVDEMGEEFILVFDKTLKEECLSDRIIIKGSAYTWQEILWEYSEEFLGASYMICGNCLSRRVEHADLYDHCKCSEESVDDGECWVGDRCSIHSHTILDLLQRNKYEEADLYFRKHCVLIKNK